MQNAHLRMGRLEYVKAPNNSKSASTHIVIWMDRAIVEPPPESGSSAVCHLLSAFGGEQEIAAIAAAISEQNRFTISGPGLARSMVSLCDRAVVFRGSITLAERKHPVKHLVALSDEFSQTQAGANPGATRTVLYDSEPHFLLYRLGVRFGLPVLPEWSRWVADELEKCKLIQDLPGLGCSPVLVRADKKTLLGIISAGLKHQRLQIPDHSPVVWRVRESVLMCE
jgi:hypothetical protein